MEHECKELLLRAGIPTNSTLVAQSVDEAVKLSDKIGYPVVLKVLSPEVVQIGSGWSETKFKKCF